MCRLAAGIVAVILTVLTALPAPAVAHEQHVPPPYRWVAAPAGMAGGEAPPGGTTATLQSSPTGSLPRSVATDDGQLFAMFPEGAFPEASAVVIDVRVLDPETLAPAPAGSAFDSNAYEIEDSGDGATQQRAITVALRYARVGGTLVVLDAGRWTPVPSDAAHDAAQQTAEVDGLGTYAVLADVDALAAAAADESGTRRPALPAIVGAALVVALVLLGLIRRRRLRRGEG